MATDLVRYVADEVAADGPEGSSWERLNTFIDDFVAQQSAELPSEQQLVDEDLRRYVVEALLRLPNLHAGRFVPPGDKATGQDASDDKKALRAQLDEEKAATKRTVSLVDSLNQEGSDAHVQIEEGASERSSAEWMSIYGSSFRLVADKDSVEAMSRAASPDISASAYRLLLYVTRSRGAGVSFTEMGSKFGYSASTSFFLAKQLCDAGLTSKYRAKNDNGSLVSWIVANRYAHLNFDSTNTIDNALQQDESVDDEEEVDQDGEQNDTHLTDVQLQKMSSEAVNELIRKGNRNAKEGEEDVDLVIDEGVEDGGNEASGQNDSSNLVSLHGLLAYPALKDATQENLLLRDRNTVRLRLLKLLLASRNNATIQADLIFRIGINDADPTKRKAFNAVVRQMETEGLLQRCLLKRPLHDNKDHTEACWMATPKGVEHYKVMTSSEQQKETRRERKELSREAESRRGRIDLETPFDRQLLDQIMASGETGMTLESLNTLFGGSSDRRRDLDSMLTSFKKPSSLYYDDYVLFSALEQNGRTRSQRFYVRQWRPEKLAPHEARRLEGRAHESWIALPFEKSFASAVEARQHLPAPASAKTTRRAVKQEDQDSSTQSKAKKRKEVNPAMPDRPERPEIHKKPKGRPRIHFTEKAQAVAKKYQEKKQAREKEEEERRRVENLLGESSDPRASASSQEVSRNERSAKRTRKSTNRLHEAEAAHSRADDESESSALQVNIPSTGLNESTLAAATETSGQGAPSTAVTSVMKGEKRPRSASITNSVGEHKKRAQGGKALEKRASINMTLQLKYEAMQQFFREVGILESSQFEAAFRKFVRADICKDGNIQAYEMDRKLRGKLLNSLEKAGYISSKKVPAPALSKGNQRVVWHLCILDESRLAPFCRLVSEGKTPPIDRWDNIGSKQQTILDVDEVDAPNSFFVRLERGYDFAADTLEELLSNKSFQYLLLNHPMVRSQYIGRLFGAGSRLQYFHSTVVELLQSGRAETHKKGAWIFDANWWACRATLQQYLKIALPSKDDSILLASQEPDILSLPVEKVSEEIRAALQVTPGSRGCAETLRPLLGALRLFQLARPVTVENDGSVVELDDASEDHLLFKFAPAGRLVGWKGEEAKMAEAEQPYDFSSAQQLNMFWRAVEDNCLSLGGDAAPQMLHPMHATLRKTLQQRPAWTRHYRLMKPQSLFLKKTLTLGLEASVMDDDILLSRIAKATFAPQRVIRTFYARNFGVSATRKPVGERKGGTGKSDFATPGAAEKVVLTVRQANKIKRKALEAQKKRLDDFDNVISTCLDDLQIEGDTRAVIRDGLTNVRREYGKGEGGLTLKTARRAFDEVMRGVQAGSTRVPHRATGKGAVASKKAKAARQSVQSAVDSETSRSKSGKDGRRSRKSAYEWTKAKDELLRDAVTILRARDQYRSRSVGDGRKNWSALDQILPDVTSTVRNHRFEMLRKAVGEEAYLNQLQVEWDSLWAEYRDTDELQDDDPGHPTAFDLMEHVRFLRANVDKLAVAGKVDNETGDPLPLNGARMLEYFDYERPLQHGPDPYAVLPRYSQTDNSTEDRSKLLRAHALTFGTQAMGIVPAGMPTAQGSGEQGHGQREIGVAMGLVKMVLCTKDAEYSEPVATALCTENAKLHSMNKALVEMQQAHMIKRKAKEERQLPNRNFTFTEEYDKFHTEMLETVPFWILCAQLERLGEEKEATIFRRAVDDEMAASLNLLGAGKTDASMDLSSIEGIKMEKFFNAKKLNDYKLEVPVHLRLQKSRRLKVDRKWTDLSDESNTPTDAILQWYEDGSTTPPIEEGVEKAWQHWSSSLSGEVERSMAKDLHKLFLEAGPDGVDWSISTLTESHINLLRQAALHKGKQKQPPLLFFTGYAGPRVVSAHYIKDWTVTVANGRHLCPYKWTDIHGNHLGDIWTQAVRLVVHAIITRPGITRAQLLTQFKLVMDRREICAIIDHVCSKKIVSKFLSFDDTIRDDKAEWQARSDSDVALMAAPIVGM